MALQIRAQVVGEPRRDAYDGLRQLVAGTLVNDCGGIAWCNKINGRVVEIIRYQRGVVNVTFDQSTSEPTYRIGERAGDPADKR